MEPFSIWPRFGFSDNPYSEKTLEADEVGHQLIVGRDSEIRNIQRRIGSNGSHVAIEGPVGAGKTSLINVASFRMKRHCIDRKEGMLFLPAVDRFQAERDSTLFERKVFMVIAQTIISNIDSFEEVGLQRPDLSEIDRWLNSPQYNSHQGGLGVATATLNYGSGSEPNTSSGFGDDGFPRAVRRLLEACFPGRSGGIICVLDNLEILESVGAARRALEELRDRIFNIPQLYWVLCGSRGIVSRARSERMAGIFQAPMVVER